MAPISAAGRQPTTDRTDGEDPGRRGVLVLAALTSHTTAGTVSYGQDGETRPLSGLPQTRRKVKEIAGPADATPVIGGTGHLILPAGARDLIGLVESSFPMARSSTTARTQQHIPLGSLTQPGARAGASCRACGSERVTRIAMNLTDGSPVEFTSCHKCEHRTWAEQGTAQALPVGRVLDKTRKVV